ncbi:unnamed protein product [Caenorhabditis auriculariae]|uniref:G-protein coupled receptors family 1 profile domain-containing protein n=1 Tax=Caenorhabditis auriculariae TaxID=2777116 RepID=A0A8S1HBW0_9PELO|nr:unnamed protein product [Caenorhabditis auriculariae]
MPPNASGQWSEIQCDYFDTVRNYQNSVYKINFDGSPIVPLYGLVCTFGAIANFVVLFAFARTANLRNLRNSFIVNLAFSDLLLCVVTAPVTLYTSLNLFWPFGDISCKVLAGVQAVNTFVSSLTLAFIAMDRVLLTLCPVKWRLAATAPVMCYFVVWVISIMVALPYALAVRSKLAPFDPWNDRATPKMLSFCNKGFPEVCAEMQEAWDNAAISKTTYTFVVLGIQYLLPLGALAYAYFQIGATIRKRSKVSRTVDQSRRLHMQNRNRRALLLLFLLVLTYAICWAPMNVYHVLNGLEFINYSQNMYLFCHLVGIASACVNPIVYALVNESFRNALHSMILSFRPCYVTTAGGASTNVYSYTAATKADHITVVKDALISPRDKPADV